MQRKRRLQARKSNGRDATGEGPAPWRLLLAEQLNNLLGGNGTLPQQAPRTVTTGEINDGRGHVARRLAAVDDQGKTIAQLVANFLRIRAFNGYRTQTVRNNVAYL